MLETVAAKIAKSSFLSHPTLKKRGKGMQKKVSTLVKPTTPLHSPHAICLREVSLSLARVCVTKAGPGKVASHHVSG